MIDLLQNIVLLVDRSVEKLQAAYIVPLVVHLVMDGSKTSEDVSDSKVGEKRPYE